jgi:ABC-type dipeptide/oligopeptide/nickel transport system permease subunit
MNWFQRHLNWTWVLTVTIGSVILGFILGFITGLVDPYAYYISDAALTGLSYLIAVIVAIIVGWWVLREKKRKLWWLLIILVPFGWIVFLCLENRSQVIDIADSEVAIRPKEKAD